MRGWSSGCGLAQGWGLSPRCCSSPSPATSGRRTKGTISFFLLSFHICFPSFPFPCSTASILCSLFTSSLLLLLLSFLPAPLLLTVLPYKCNFFLPPYSLPFPSLLLISCLSLSPPSSPHLVPSLLPFLPCHIAVFVNIHEDNVHFFPLQY